MANRIITHACAMVREGMAPADIACWIGQQNAPTYIKQEAALRAEYVAAALAEREAEKARRDKQKRKRRVVRATIKSRGERRNAYMGRADIGKTKSPRKWSGAFEYHPMAPSVRAANSARAERAKAAEHRAEVHKNVAKFLNPMSLLAALWAFNGIGPSINHRIRHGRGR